MIKIQNLSKVYRVYNHRGDRLKEWFSPLRRTYHSEFWALNDVSFTIQKGEVCGIIGMNGAGKSTLLKIITGTTVPSSGDVVIEGRIAALLELGTGFHPELTGRENVQMNGRLLGLTDEEVVAKLPEIESFAELGEFFDKPVRTYSSGMYVRLAFSLASCVDPDVLIIDEALSVGDAYFQQKCLQRIRRFKKEGVTILFVSHDAGAVKTLCDRAVFLHQGKVQADGDPIELLDLYNAMLAQRDGSGREYIIESAGGDGLQSGNGRAKIAKVRLENMQGLEVEACIAGDNARIVIEVEFHDDVDDSTVGILIRDRLGYDIFGTNTAEMFQEGRKQKTGDRVRYCFDCRMNLGPGDYTITAAAHRSTTHTAESFDWIDRILTFKVLPRSDFRFLGVSLLEPKVSVEQL